MISVVIPTKDRSDKIARALQSVTAQTEDDWEIIVVDDGSSPEEAERIARSVAATRNARLVVMPHNGGAARARNAGVAAAAGDIIAFLDSDDWWLPERLAQHHPLFQDRNIVVTHNRARITRGGAEQAKGTVGHPPPAGWSSAVALAAWNYVGGCSLVCVRRETFMAVGGFDASLPSAEDWDLWMKLAQKGEFRFIDQVLGYYDAGPHERLTTSRNKILEAHDRLYREAAAIPQTPAEKRYVAAVHHWSRAEIAIMFGNGAGTLRELTASLFTKPTRFAVQRAPKLVLRGIAALARSAWTSGSPTT